jgi:hypothetical protein
MRFRRALLACFKGHDAKGEGGQKRVVLAG